MKKYLLLILLVIVLIIPAIAVGTTDIEQESVKLNIIEFLKNMDWINISLVVFFMVGGGSYAIIARGKLKQVGELLIKVYEYTDDKVLSKEEREDLWLRIKIILGKTTAEKKLKDIQSTKT